MRGFFFLLLLFLSFLLFCIVNWRDVYDKRRNENDKNETYLSELAPLPWQALATKFPLRVPVFVAVLSVSLSEIVNNCVPPLLRAAAALGLWSFLLPPPPLAGTAAVFETVSSVSVGGDSFVVSLLFHFAALKTGGALLKSS